MGSAGNIIQLKELRLKGMAQECERQEGDRLAKDLGFGERAAMLIQAEAEKRADSAYMRRMKESGARNRSAFIHDVRVGAQRGLDRDLLASIASCEWIAKAQGLIITGATGTGKTYLASAICENACRRGYSAKYFRIPDLLQMLEEARHEKAYIKLLGDLQKPSLLVLDGFGLSPLNPQHCRDLMEAVDKRHELKATAVAGQLPFKDWHRVFEDATLADAVMDRLKASRRVDLKGPSLRERIEG